jgi:predicted DNA-binding antitoxin AbrB/MazE fold protein
MLKVTYIGTIAMIQVLEALYDGTTLHPDGPLNLVAGTRVRIVVEAIRAPVAAPPKSFLQTAQALQLQGEPDWSAQIDR